MPSMRTHLAITALVAITALAFGSTIVLADDGPAPTLRVRPPDTVLRHVDAATAEITPSPTHHPHAREVVVLVGGYQSCSCIEDNTFDALRTRLIASGFDVVRFGQDPRYPYDTFGHIQPSALSLRDEIRHLGGEYDAVHVVTHSMGGVVADQAFANGLSASDGVATYVSWSSPHSGSDAARALGVVRAVRGDGGLLRDVLLRMGDEPDSDAARDLASTRPISPPRGVVRHDLREANDLLETGQDASDPGVTSRVLGGHGAEGHGGILTDPTAIDTTVATIATRRVPPDTRASVLRDAAERESRGIGTVVFVALCVLTVALCVRTFDQDRVASVVSFGMRFLPPAARKRCA